VSLIEQAKLQAVLNVNKKLLALYWQIGKGILQKQEKFGWGAQVVEQLAKDLSISFPDDKSLLHCLRVAETFSEEEILSAVRRQFSWTHIKTLCYISDPLARQFYMEMCRIEHWDTRTLDAKIDAQLYERTAISRKPEEVIKQELDQLKNDNTLNPDLVFRSSYFLDMLGLSDVFSEKDLETAIVTQLQNFICEMGTDFAFLGRQKRITVDAVDYYIDLLFYHRSLHRLVVIDLKLGKFKPEYEGQMLLYLRYLNNNERREGEESPIGLILCSEGNTEHIEYLMLDDNSPIKVAQYYTQLPDKKLLAEKLQRAIAIAREHFAERKLDGMK
jgi:predicted nuclease of restriction endonuclease-like (RecB) superfamily